MADLRTRLSGWKWNAQYRYSRILTRIGERTGIDSLTYNDFAYEMFARDGRLAFPPFARILREAFPQVQSAIDLGCGTGHLVAALRAEGIAADGYEYVEKPRLIAKRELDLTLNPFDLTHPPSLPRVDLATSIEVAEHIPPFLGDTLVGLLASHAPLIVFTAATPGQGGTGHINEQPREYWIDRFVSHGCDYAKVATEQIAEQARQRVKGSPWIARNLMIFQRSSQ
jgi:SAM-dependent methyltransferase